MLPFLFVSILKGRVRLNEKSVNRSVILANFYNLGGVIMKDKYIKYLILILGILVVIIGFTIHKNADKAFNGGFISSYWIDGENNNGYSVNIDLERGYSQEEIELFTNIATKKRKKEIDISEAGKLGNPTHEMRVFISEESTGITKWVFDYKLWLKEDVGYIQSDNDNLRKINKLNDEEHKFVLNSLLKYHSAEEIFKK